MLDYEKAEIMEYSQIYFLGLAADKPLPSQNVIQNYGFDDERGDLKINKKDHIAYRYEVMNILGKGSFG